MAGSNAQIWTTLPPNTKLNPFVTSTPTHTAQKQTVTCGSNKSANIIALELIKKHIRYCSKNTMSIKTCRAAQWAGCIVSTRKRLEALWTGCTNKKTFTGFMDWMYQHENVDRLYGLDVSTRKRWQALWTGCMNTKTFTGSMDWTYEHKNIYRLYGLDVWTQKHLQALWTGCIKAKTFRGSMDWMYEHKKTFTDSMDWMYQSENI